MPDRNFPIGRCIRFAILAGMHALLLGVATSLPDWLAGCVVFVSWLPWLPLAWLGLPVMVAPAIPIPNLAGNLWSIVVWAVFYWWLAGFIGRRAGHTKSGPAIAE